MFESNGHSVNGLVPDIAKLLNRGGLFSMMSTILLVFCAFAFAGVLSLTGSLNVVLGKFYIQFIPQASLLLRLLWLLSPWFYNL